MVGYVAAAHYLTTRPPSRTSQ